MKKAFSLIEILLVIAVLSVTFIGVMSLTDRILQMENIVKNDFIAQGLLQEGSELVQAAAYFNTSSSLPFFNNLNGASADGSLKTFAADYMAVTSTYAPAHFKVASNYKDTTNNLVKFDTASFYALDSTAGTNFYRWFTSTYHTTGTSPLSHDYLDVDVNVYWEERGRGHLSTTTVRVFNPYY